MGFSGRSFYAGIGGARKTTGTRLRCPSAADLKIPLFLQ